MHVIQVLPLNYKRRRRQFDTGLARLSERISRAMKYIKMGRLDLPEKEQK